MKIDFLVLFRVKWRLKDIDWPTCMSYIEFVYYDTVYNESVFIHTYDGPFVDKMEFELLNTQVPCDDEYSHITRVSQGGTRAVNILTLRYK